MTVFQYLELFATFAASTEMPVAEMGALHLASGNESAIIEVAESFASKVAEDFEKGDTMSFASAWMVLSRFKTAEEANRELLQPLVDLAVNWDENEVLKSPEVPERWLIILEMMLGQTDPKLMAALEGFDTLPSKYGILAIASGKGDRASRWYYSLSAESEPFFYSGLEKNQLLRRLKKVVNPEDLDPAELEDQPRIDLVKTYMAHPFVHRLQPFYSKTFEQFVGWKMLTPDELFENGEALVEAHFRQGVAYLDLARLHRKSGHLKEALKYIDKGMTTRLQLGNRRGSYLLEKVIVLREAGQLDDAWAVLGEVPHEHLDGYNRELIAKVTASLRELDR